MGKYIALSHCWGNPSTSRIPTTTIATLSERKSTIPLSSLTKTFQDAIAVTQKLGIRYIWIDSLCIIQDSQSDWQNEVTKMCDVYRNAHLTIAATDAANGSEGCFRTRDGWLIRPCELPLEVDLGPDSKAPICFHSSPPTMRLTEKPVPKLVSRAWTYQERVLSPRTLSYNANGLSWHCIGESWAETGDYQNEGNNTYT